MTDKAAATIATLSLDNKVGTYLPQRDCGLVMFFFSCLGLLPFFCTWTVPIETEQHVAGLEQKMKMKLPKLPRKRKPISTHSSTTVWLWRCERVIFVKIELAEGGKELSTTQLTLE